MGKIEGQPARVYGDECLPGVLVVEREPVPDVHERTERQAEHEAERGECDAATEQLRRKRSGDAARSPAEHLPRGPGALSEEEVRHERRQGSNREAAPRSERGARRNGHHSHRLDTGYRGKQNAARSGRRAQGCDQRQLLGRVRATLEPDDADREQRESDEQQGQAVVRPLERSRGCLASIPPSPSAPSASPARARSPRTPTATSSSARSRMQYRVGSWRSMPARPCSSAVPESGVNNPAASLAIVVLPVPLAPASATISPRNSSRSTLSTTGRPAR